ncbi:hypothetical protein ACH4T9_12775 [Micromonospora sp. NPDC020750]|uniref:hypothetical protein n=1 Tax=unclassified Micromonospora TaxID=2617518 RepID=UPI00378918FD
MDEIKARHLLKEADHKDRWAAQLRADQQYLLAEAARKGAEAAKVEADAAGCRVQAATLAAGES